MKKSKTFDDATVKQIEYIFANFKKHNIFLGRNMHRYGIVGLLKYHEDDILYKNVFEGDFKKGQY